MAEYFDQILVDHEVLSSALVKRIMDRAPEGSIKLVSGREGADSEVIRHVGGGPSHKRMLFITEEKGRFLKRCPGTPGMKCCNLFVLNPIVGCTYDCTYCFLQAYQNEPYVTLYANIESLKQEVEGLIADNKGQVVRISTGELSDSLALEPLVDVSTRLVNLFAEMDGALLELKTKSTRIESLLHLDHRRRTVISWSLNPKSVAGSEEHGPPGPQARLRAAAAACEAGYPVAFHFDPIIRSEGCIQGYADLVEDLFNNVPQESVRWISMGGFRYTPAMKGLIKRRFPETRLFLQEFVPCPDGKYRYFSKHRIELYIELLRAVRARGPRVPVYLCMEPAFVWRKVFGFLPEESGLLDCLFAHRNC